MSSLFAKNGESIHDEQGTTNREIVAKHLDMGTFVYVLSSSDSMSKAIFAAYKGDRFIAEGTSRELAKALGVKIETVYFYRSPAYARRGSGKNRMVVIRVED